MNEGGSKQAMDFIYSRLRLDGYWGRGLGILVMPTLFGTEPGTISKMPIVRTTDWLSVVRKEGVSGEFRVCNSEEGKRK